MGIEQEVEAPTAPLPDHVSIQNSSTTLLEMFGKILNTLNKLPVVCIPWWSLGKITYSGPGEMVTRQ
jgi:hypothetical protein